MAEITNMEEITNLNDLETKKDYILKYMKPSNIAQHEEEVAFVEGSDGYGYTSVSYTHLTLPTKA